MKCADDIDLEQPLPDVVCDLVELGERNEFRRAGAIDEDVDPAELGGDGRDHLADGGVIGDVSLNCERLHAEQRDFAGGLFGFGFRAGIDNRDVTAETAEGERGSPADAGSTAGDDGGFVFEEHGGDPMDGGR